MPREARYTEFLERRYQYKAWKTPPEVEALSGLRLPLFKGDELPGWNLRRASHFTQPDGTPLVRGFWVAEHDADRVLDVEVFDLDAARGAREFVLTLLGDMQGAPAAREPDETLGDVAFRLGDSAVVFARRNLVIRIRSAGCEIESGIPPARVLDDRLKRSLD